MYEPGQQNFWARQRCPRSGRYTVHHYQHRLAHSVLVFEGETFPPCHICGERVRFAPEGATTMLADDPDFRRIVRNKAA